MLRFWNMQVGRVAAGLKKRVRCRFAFSVTLIRMKVVCMSINPGGWHVVTPRFFGSGGRDTIKFHYIL